MRDRTNKQLAEKLDIIKESFNENGSVFELLTIVQERLNSIPIEPPVKPANGVIDVVAIRMVNDLKGVVEELLNVMDIQEKRWNEEFHLSAEAFKSIWDEAKEKANFTLSQMDG